MEKIMLVEDDNNLREIYQARLQAEGYEIVSAQDGEEALVVAKAEKPDLIISDVMMPKISGFEMLDILRNTEELKNVKVIMLTALAQSDDQQRADRLGADHYLVKSQVTLEDIVKVTQNLLHSDPAGGQAQPAAAAEPPAAAHPITASSPATDSTIQMPSSVAVTDEATPTVSDQPAAPVSPTSPPSISNGARVQSAAQEEANAETKIEDFVAGATSDPTPPASTVPTNEATTTSDSTTSPHTTEDIAPAVSEAVAPAASAFQSKPESEAITTESQEEPPADPRSASTPPPVVDTPLAASASTNEPATVSDPPSDPPPQATAVTPTPTPANSDNDNVTVASEASNTTAPVQSPETAATPEASTPAETESNKVTVIANKKVIKPLDLPPKKDIHTLLALEEVAEKAKQGPPPPTAIISNDNADGVSSIPPTQAMPESPTPAAQTKISTSSPSNAAASEEPGVHIDPNSIAI